MPVVNCLVMSIALDTFGLLNVANTRCVTPLPTVLTLQDTWVHIGTIYCNNETSNIKLSVDNSFGLETILSVPYINPDDSYIQFQRDFDDSWPWGEDNIVENVVFLKNIFNILVWDASVQLLI